MHDGLDLRLARRPLRLQLEASRRRDSEARVRRLGASGSRVKQQARYGADLEADAAVPSTNTISVAIWRQRAS